MTIFAIVLFRTAWVCDDAFITLRTVDNFVNGYGLTWNVAERVQAYTHPLWMFLLSLIHIFTGNGFVTALVLSIFVSLVAIVLYIRRIPASWTMAIVGVLALISSKFYIDYSTSGLENPLTHLLLVLLLIEYFKNEHTRRSLLLLSFYSSLILITRIDAITLVIPILLYRFWKQRSPKAIGTALLGAVPFLVWEIFSVFYYGSFIPNTAYAKLNTGIAKLDLVMQGFRYFEAALRGDYVLILAIVGAAAFGLVKRNSVNVPIVLGMLLYLLSIVWAGGCFMGGRFFTGPFLVAVILLTSQIKITRTPVLLTIGVVILLIGLIVPGASLPSGSSYGTGDGRGLGYNIDDHRYLCFQTSGMITAEGWQCEPNHEWEVRGREYNRQAGDSTLTVTAGGVGYVGYYSGPRVYLIDYYALADPLFSRLPTIMDIKWRAGHFRRAIPDGYVKSVSTGLNQIEDPYLAAYYDTLAIVVKKPLWSFDRTLCAVEMAFGGYDYLLEFARPLWLTKNYKKVNTPVPEGTRWWSPDVTALPTKGLRIVFESLCFADSLNISLDNNDDYILRFSKDADIFSEMKVQASHKPAIGLAHYTVELPEAVRLNGINALFIIPVENDREYALGHVTLF